MKTELEQKVEELNARIQGIIDVEMKGRKYDRFDCNYSWKVDDKNNSHGFGSYFAIIYEEQGCFVGWGPTDYFLLTADTWSILIDKIILWHAENNLRDSLAWEEFLKKHKQIMFSR